MSRLADAIGESMKLQTSIVAMIVFALMSACAKDPSTPGAETGRASADEVTPEEASAIAEEAYVYAFPMIENYRTMYVQAIDRTAPGYAGSFNQLVHKT